jgi:DNA repair photolyase
MPLISNFDPWRSSLCTCPPKLTFNPYTGCDHACVYCYASSYIASFHKCRPKSNLLLKLEKEARRLKGQTLSIANSSDPYPSIEAENEITRSCLEILGKSNCKVQIITKSTIVQRDIDLLKMIPSMVAITITTLSDEIAKIIEPHAPPSTSRLKTVEELIDHQIPVAVRIDPIILSVNDNPEELVETLASLGVKHITSSTFKVKPDNWKRLKIAQPLVADRLRPLYFDKEERLGDSYFLPRELRFSIMTGIKKLADKYNLRFGVCREGFSELNTAACDGSWLLEKN